MKLQHFKYLLPLLFMIPGISAFSQKRKVTNYTEIGALLHSSNSLDNGSRFNGFRTRTGVSRIIRDHFGLGFALGTDNYKRQNGGYYNTLPLTFNGSWFAGPDLSGFKADIYGGYAVKLFNNFNRGLTAGAGISYSIPVRSSLNLGLQTGYNYQEMDFPSTFIEKSFNVSSFRLGAGITFK